MVVRVATGGARTARDAPVGSRPVIDLLKAVVLGVIQGLTESLPISSSAHLRIFPELFGWGDPGAAFTAVVPISTALALIPGVSRSGATLSMGRFLGYDRETATRYAFLLAIPAVIGAGVFQLKDIPNGENLYGWGPTIVATVVSFIVGYAAIAWLLRYVTTHSYTPFVIYRIALGSLTLLLVATGVIAA